MFRFQVITALLLSSQAFAAQFSNNPVKEALKKRESVIGGYVSIADAKIVENLALPKKLSFLWIEALQNDLGPKDVQTLVIAAENEGIVPIVRVPKNDRDEIKKFLGTGAMGVVIPGVRNRRDAEAAVSFSKFPPEGVRPPGVERANRYMGRIKEYMSTANQNTLVILTVDNKDFVKNIDEILAVRGIDVIHIGPLHLSSDMQVAMESTELKTAIEKVINAANKAGVPLGGALAKRSQLPGLEKKGYKFFTAPGDMELLRSGIDNFFSGQ